MGTLSKILIMPLLIFLTAGINSCQTTDSTRPQKPIPLLYIPIVEQEFCDREKKNCQIKSFCRIWENQNGTWVLKEVGELKKCHGILGVTSEQYVKLLKYDRETEQWIKRNCVFTNN